MENRKNRLKQAIKMEDIAKKAGVSKSAVSKALNFKPDISEKMRKHIFKVCEEMNYQVNFRIQDMIKERKSGMTHNIAFVKVGSSFSDPAYAGAIDGISRAASENNLRLLLEHLDGTEKSLYDLPPVLRDSRIDGFIITGQLNQGVMDLVSKLDIPFIVLGTYDQSLINGFYNIVPDLQTGMEDIIAAFKSKGIQRIGFFIEKVESLYEKELIRVFKRALKVNDLNFDERILYVGTGLYSGAINSLKGVFSERELPFEGMVCMDFRGALDISSLAHTHSQRFSSKPITIATRKHFPGYLLPISTIFYDNQLAEITYAGVSLLLDIINGNDTSATKQIVIPTKIELSNGSF